MIHEHVFDVIGMIDQKDAEIQNAQPDQVAILAHQTRKVTKRIAVVERAQRPASEPRGRTGRKLELRSRAHHFMLRAGHALVNEWRVRNSWQSAGKLRADDRRCLCIQRTRSKIQPPRVAPSRNQAPQAQTCCGYAQCDSAIHPESQPQETHPRVAAREISLQTRVLALLSISSDATRERQSPRKMFFQETAMQTRRPAKQPRFCSGCVEQFLPRTRGCTRDSSLAPRASATLPSQRPVPRQFPGRARPIPFPTKSTEANAFASRCARKTKRKTSSRTDSQKHVHTAAQKEPPRVSEREFCAGNARAVAKTISMHHISGFDYCRLARQLAIGEDENTIAASDRFAAARRQTGQRCTRKDFPVGGKAR